MVFEGMRCSACGGNEFRRGGGRVRCAFCGAEGLFKLLPGTICGEGDGACAAPASSLCRGCGTPLCDRHNDPKRHYWMSPLDWGDLCPGWGPAEGREWVRLQTPFQHFPVPGFIPFPWVDHENPLLGAVGFVEEELVAKILPAVRQAGGDLTDQVCVFDSVCRRCFDEAERLIGEAVEANRDRYGRLAFAEGLDALERELNQSRRYVEAFLQGPLPEPKNGVVAELPPPLGPESSKDEWLAAGHEILCRLAALNTLREKLPARWSTKRSGEGEV